ncbi:hypothetical protein [Roseateles sp.]|uniref:hypothetical protein n=1 Tax=Roseateles sp. TaxID=1971397 RepID=UPI0025DA8546|nr:hypothetical protein [Roseateles sp.]MBV8036285.1 hypothetical protein [Roseateles sp.]
MSERQINAPQSRPEAPAAVDATARQLASARRRRFIKLGGAAVPTALTLASRPVMAWHCNTASTWGSAQGMSNSSYVRSQDATRLFPDETYTTTCWLNNTTRAGLSSNPWARSPLNCNTTATTNSAYYKSYTVAQLLAGTTATITGVSPADTVWSILNGTPKKPSTNPANGNFVAGSSTCGDFQKLMLVAWLNFKVLNSTLNKCLMPGTTNVLVKLGNTTYVGPTGATWTQADVILYLKKNWIACYDDACV